MKARATPVGPCAATNCSAALKAVDAECNVIGSGATHVLTSQFFESYDKAFQVLHAEELQYLNRAEEDSTRSFMIESIKQWQRLRQRKLLLKSEFTPFHYSSRLLNVVQFAKYL